MTALVHSPGVHRPFADALLDPEQPSPPGLKCWNGSDPARRFAVYRNNVMVSLIDALAETFPVSCALLGDAAFRHLARCYVMHAPPRSAVLCTYGETLPDFIAGLLAERPHAEPPSTHAGNGERTDESGTGRARQTAPRPAGSSLVSKADANGTGVAQLTAPPALPLFLPDLARLELLRVRAFHAADASPMPAADVAAKLTHPDALPRSRLQLHPSLAVLRSRYAIVSLWAAHQGELDGAGVDPMQPQCALVLRSGFDPVVIGIDSASAQFIEQLVAGATLGAASAAASANDPGFDLSRTFALLLQHGALCGWS